MIATNKTSEPNPSKKYLKEFCGNATTAIYAYVQHFEDEELYCMRLFIEEEMKRREKK